MSYRDQPKEHWEAALKEIEKKQYFKDEARGQYELGKIKNGELFIIKGAETATEKKIWCMAVFLNKKMIYVKHSANDRRLEVLKMKAASHLLDAVKRGWTDTRQAPWLPPKFQNIKRPDLVIYGSKSTESFESASGRTETEKKIKEKDQVIEEVKDVTSEVL